MQDETIRGVVERIVYKNADNGYHVLTVKLSGKTESYTVTGNHVRIHEGTTMEFNGQWTTNPRYGKQFQASSIVEVAPETKEALVKYLSSSFFKGIGPVIAKKIVEHFGEDVLHVLKTDIDKLLTVPGISKKKLQTIKDAWELNSEINEIMVFLQAYNISTLFAVKIYETYGRDCINQIRINPYKLADDIKGIGFKYSDNIALDLGFKKDSPERISAGIKYALSQSENDGHCYLLHEQLVEKTTSLLEVRIKELIGTVLEILVSQNEIKLTEVFGDKRYYSNVMFYDERYVVKKIDILKEHDGLVHDDSVVDKWKGDLEDGKFGMNLSDEQKEAIYGIINEKISILTGGAGVGKTTVLKSLLNLFKELKIDYHLAAPTGRASKQIEEATGAHASTIHRLLGWDFTKGSFMHNEENQLSGEMFIIDETSMVGISLMASLLRAIPPDAHVLFVGDMNQIPPVNAGNPFKDLINSGFVKTFRLTKIFRQTEGSDIINFSNQIINGIEPDFETPLLNPEMWSEKKSCMFIDSDFFDPYKSNVDYPDYSTLHYGIDIKDMLRRLYMESIPKYYKEIKDIQIIIPQNVGEVGTVEINKLIQDTINPPKEGKLEIKIADRILREGDKVIVIQNDYDYGIFNGDLGRIISVSPEEKSCIVEFGGEQKTIEIKRDGLLLLRLGYAISVHKAQGAEFEAVIIPMVMNFYNMLYRQLLYTAISRAKKLCIFLGHRRTISISVQNVDQTKRQTSLIELLNLRG